MKKTILTLALTLGVPALITMAQPAPTDPTTPPPPPHDAPAAGPMHSPGPAADQAGRPTQDAQPGPEHWSDRQGPGHARLDLRDDRDDDRGDRGNRGGFAHRPPPRGDFGPDREGGPRQYGRGPQHGDNFRPEPPIALIAALDANHDGVIDAKEIANAIEVLRSLDRNGDGKLTPDEFMGPRHHRGPGGPEGRADFRGPRGPEGRPGMQAARGPEGRFEDRRPGRAMSDIDDRGPGRGMPGGPGPRPPMTPGDAPQPPAAPAHPEAPQAPQAPADPANGVQ